MSDANAIEEILRLEKARSDAIVNKDAAAADKLFADDLVYIHSSGRLDTKQSFVGKLADGSAAYTRFDFSNVKVRVYGNCAIVSGDVLISAGSQLDLRFTDVWVKGAAGWRNVHWHSVKRAA
jgi:ketosteroid isomerase-like protein